jgi:hypothetical protein
MVPEIAGNAVVAQGKLLSLRLKTDWVPLEVLKNNAILPKDAYIDPTKSRREA